MNNKRQSYKPSYLIFQIAIVGLKKTRNLLTRPGVTNYLTRHSWNIGINIVTCFISVMHSIKKYQIGNFKIIYTGNDRWCMLKYTYHTRCFGICSCWLWVAWTDKLSLNERARKWLVFNIFRENITHFKILLSNFLNKPFFLRFQIFASPSVSDLKSEQDGNSLPKPDSQ